jgi:hypothetical protein
MVGDIYYKRVLPAIRDFQGSEFAEVHEQLNRDVEASFQRVKAGTADSTNPIDIKMQEIYNLVKKRERDGLYIPGQYESGKDSDTVIKESCYDTLYKEQAARLVEHIVETELDKALKERVVISFTPDGKDEPIGLELKKLPVAVGKDRITGLIAGPPACGKGTAVALFLEETKAAGVPEEHIVKINTDYYRGFFSLHERLDDDVRFHTILTHDEAGLTSQLTIARLKRLIAENNGRHAMLDTVTLSQQMVDIGTYLEGRMIIKVMTLDPEIAINRSIERGRMTGRFVPTSYMIDAHKAVGGLLVDALTNNLGKQIVATVYDSDVLPTELPKPVLSADLFSAEARVADPDILQKVIERKYMVMNPYNISDVHFALPAIPTPPATVLLAEEGYRVYKGYEPEMPDIPRIDTHDGYTRAVRDIEVPRVSDAAMGVIAGALLWNVGKNAFKKAWNYLSSALGEDATPAERASINKLIEEKIAILTSANSVGITKIQSIIQDLRNEYKIVVEEINILYDEGKEDSKKYKTLREKAWKLKTLFQESMDLEYDILEISEQFEKNIKMPANIKKGYLDEFAERVRIAEEKFNELSKTHKELFGMDRVFAQLSNKSKRELTAIAARKEDGIAHLPIGSRGVKFSGKGS